MRISTLFAGLGLTTALNALPAFAQNAIPTDAQPSCAVSADEFSKWVVGGTDANPLIAPPDGFTTAFDSECAFFKWGAQMFLWLTSSDGDDYVFDATGFFDVVHDTKGSEKIAQVEVLPNGDGNPNILALRDIKNPNRGGSGQAGGGGVLLSQDNVLTYYGMHVNDAYVAFRNGFLDDPDSFNFTDNMNSQQNLFPSTAKEIAQIVDYGVNTDVITGDPYIANMVGPLEIKTSWVDASTVNKNAFVVITAQVPKFTPKSDANHVWKADGVETLELAMVGLHIAAPVLDHPELVWISYEHLGNTPIGSYLYTDNTGSTATYKYNSDGSWTFAKSGAPWPTDMSPNASLDTAGNIKAADGKTVSPQDIVLFNPWGLAAQSDSDLTNNTDLVSLNASLIALLPDDANARDKYFQIGGVWSDGTLPMYQQYDVQIGGLQLANSTMESFHQFGAQDSESGFIPQNCFDCHSVSGADGKPENNLGVSVSHIFQGMKAFTP